MKNRLFVALAALTLAVLVLAGDVRQSPTEPMCPWEPELCGARTVAK